MTYRNQKMKAFVLERPGRLVWKEKPVPEPGPGEVLARSKRVGICGSDIHAYNGLQPSLVPPCILGHEIEGEIIDVNSEGYNGGVFFKEGDRVIIDPKLSCGSCSTCLLGRNNICEKLEVMSVHRDGAFAEYFTARIEQVYKVPDGVADEEAVLAEPLSIAAQAVTRGRVSKNDEVMILGAGPIGLAVLALVKAKRARAGIIDLYQNRLDAARRIGADRVINVKDKGTEEILRSIYQFSRGKGPRVVIDAAAVKQTAEIAVRCIARAGRLVVLGMAAPDVTLPYLTILKKELDVIGSRMANNQFEYVIDFLYNSGRSKLFKEAVITHVMPFTEESIRSAFSIAEKCPGEAIKVVINFDEQGEL